MMHPPDSLKARILAATKQKPAPVRRTRDRIGVVIGVAAMVLMLTVFTFAGGLDHSAGRPLSLTGPLVGGTLLIAVLATLMVLPRRGSMLSRPRNQLIGVVFAVPVVIGLWGMAFHPLYAEPFTRLGVRCFVLTMSTAPWPFVAMAYWRGRIDPVSARWTGAACMGGRDGRVVVSARGRRPRPSRSRAAARRAQRVRRTPRFASLRSAQHRNRMSM